MTQYPGDWRYTEENMKLRQMGLTILLRKFGKEDYPNLSMYECMDEWIEKGNKKCDGLVSYYKAYYNK
tara:strand:- start:2399 stop:2602 length:204 start_codon:yes stop_codon:yes gene_type:complete